MSRPTVRSRRTAPLAASVAVSMALAGLLAGCGAGQIAQTAAVRAQEGINAQQGEVGIRNVFVEHPGDEGVWEEGSDVSLVLRLTNDGGTADRLIGVTTPDAESVVLVSGPRSSAGAQEPGSGGETGAASPSTTGSPPPPIGLPSRSAAPSPTATSGSSASASPSQPGLPGEGGVPTEQGTPSPSQPGSSAAPSGTTSPPVSVPPSGTASPSGTATISVVLPPETLVALTPAAQHVLLRGTARSLTPGESVSVTFVFERAGRVTLQVPVAVPPEGATRRSPDEGKLEE